MAVWPLSHFKSGPFRLFDLTSISHVIDSPKDLFFSLISDSVSTFAANSLDNTRHSPPALLFRSHSPPLTPPLLSWLRLVSDLSVFLPLWPLMVYFVSNQIFSLLWMAVKHNFPNAAFFLSSAHLPLLLSTCIYALPKVFTAAFS